MYFVDYPDNYNDKMTAEQQDELLAWFEKMNKVYRRGEKAQLSRHGEVKFYGEKICKNTKRQIDQVIEVLDMIGIYIGYSWVGHRGKYFLITAQDAENQADYLYDLEEN